MPRNPQIRTSGAGSRREAAGIGQSIGDSVVAAVSGRRQPLRIETLRLKLPAGASGAEIDRAVRQALATHLEDRGQ